MNLILFTRERGSRQVDLLKPRALGLVVLAVATVLTAAFTLGFHVAEQTVQVDPDVRVAQLERELSEQRRVVAEAQQQAREDVEALSVRLGQLQAHVIRIDALGQRLTRMADLEEDEFDFRNPPAQGGPEGGLDPQPVSVPDFVGLLDSVAAQIDDRQRKLGVLEDMLMDRNLRSRVHPAGRPVESGWMSSNFGYRTDPFTGKRTWHDGVDFAGKAGADVVAVAAGVISWSGPRYGYGNLVEINHGNGYATRYAHNRKNLVEVGQMVRKGEVIAEMGSTGRSTAPHTHFEVLREGRKVDPLEFIRASD